MITEAIYGVLTGMLAWLLGLLPTWTAPDWIDSLSSEIATAAGQVGGLSNWIPLGHVAIVVSFILGVWLFTFGLETALRLVSHLTGGGGAR